MTEIVVVAVKSLISYVYAFENAFCKCVEAAFDYCDYCDRSFPDNAEARRKHIEGTQHQNNVKLHYDSYKGLKNTLDPAELLVENSKKSPCRKFFESGYCPFGLSCKYSHVPYGIDFSIIDPHLYLSQNPHLLQQKHPQVSTLGGPLPNSHQRQSTFKYKLPPGLPKELPPSLRPPPPDGHDYSNCAQWG
ncbi:12908_t:CDS:2 [Acaulospora colombiana]|uniref:12908_t:CDS:1 n=1 Tax=Acaulospora colombiana TaxID=27376 RepID=A0ACA9KCE4_9GLOM|nr:12908_t:CDS:2 [Acaulospora colombiana]